MDPTFRRFVLEFLKSVEAEHNLVDVDGVPMCACGAPLPEGLDRHMLTMIATPFVEPPFEPHVVHAKGAHHVVDTPMLVESEDDDESGDPRAKGSIVTGRQYVGPVDCPDCTRGLVSRGHDFICPQLPVNLKLGGTQGDIVACGLKAA